MLQGARLDVIRREGSQYVPSLGVDAKLRKQGFLAGSPENVKSFCHVHIPIQRKRERERERKWTYPLETQNFRPLPLKTVPCHALTSQPDSFRTCRSHPVQHSKYSPSSTRSRSHPTIPALSVLLPHKQCIFIMISSRVLHSLSASRRFLIL